MDFILRLPKFPVILDTGEFLIHASNRAQLQSKVSKLTFSDGQKRDIIDGKADAFALYPEKMFVAPSITARRWTKIRIIELYNAKKRQGTPELRKTSLGSRSLEQIVGEAVELLSRK